MNIFQSDTLSKQFSNIIHHPTQQGSLTFDLTVREIHRFTARGSLDFGGSEFEPAPTEPLEAAKDNPEADYGWWELEAGMYQALLNETLNTDNDTLAVLGLHAHGQRSGLLGSTQLVTASSGKALTFPFRVPEAGCRIKENARIAVAAVFG